MSTSQPQRPQLQGESLFRAHFIFWRILGNLPTIKFRKLYIFYSIVINLLITIGYPLHLMIGLFQSKTMFDVFKNMAVSLTCLVCSIKTFAIWLKFQNVVKIVEIIRKQDKRIKSPDEVKYYRIVVFPAVLRVLNLFYGLYFTAGATSELAVIINGVRGNWHLMYPAYFPFDPFTTTIHYIVANVYQFLGASFQIFQNIVNDTFTGMHLALLSGQIHILSMRLAKLGHEPRKTKAENNQLLLECIQDHKDLLEYRAKLEEIVSLYMFFQIICAGINVCAAIVFIIFFVRDPFTLIYYLFYLISMAAEIFPACYYGSIMEFEGKNLIYSLFSSNWIEQDLTYKKNLRIFAEQANKDLRVMAWIFRINLKSFLIACKNAYSLFAVIMNMKSFK